MTARFDQGTDDDRHRAAVRRAPRTAGLAHAIDLAAVANATLELPPDVTADWLVTHLDAVAGIGGAIVAAGVAAIAVLVLLCGDAAPSSGWVRPRAWRARWRACMRARRGRGGG